jgi:5S rRNA maturation endonuclease (ribonuclease M5)
LFRKIKESVNIVEALSKELNIDFKKIGDCTFEPEDSQCPFCGHKDSFRVKDNGEERYYNCFSCNAKGDVITFIEKARKLKPVEAARILAKEWNIQLPNSFSPLQEAFNLAAHYYYTCMRESCNKPYLELNKLTPLEYQTQIRRHKRDTLDFFGVGWSDGGLMTYLKGLGIDNEILAQSGLMNKKGKDFLPAKVFIYPHLVNRNVSHITFKDPLKQHAYQLKNSSKLNGHIFYNSDSLDRSKTVAIVEGENDALSIYESNWKEGLIATIGQLSSEQIEWLEDNLKGKQVITFFDSDNAGDKYREKIQTIRKSFSSLTQIRLIGHKDIDEYLTGGGKLDAAIAANNVSAEFEDLKEQEVKTDEGITSVSIVEKDGCYYRVKYKDSEPVLTKLTNFTIKLKNIFIKGIERQREVIFVRQDGMESPPVPAGSDIKVSLKNFRVFAANAIDGSFYGQENDLISMWEHVYSQGNERIVYMPEMVGRVEQFKGWLFRDLFISDTGLVTRPDEEGIIWFPGKTTGLKAMSLTIKSNGEGYNGVDIPRIDSTTSEEERVDLLKAVINNLSKNLGDTGMALTLLGWAKSNVYSDMMFDKINGFPFLFFWGKHGQGKTVISKWLASIFNMDEHGYSTMPQYKSGVGFGRKIAYYASLPVIMDEIRADLDTTNKYGDFRTWYNRSGRAMGMKDTQGIKQQDIRSNFIFVGQDQFTDAATRQRCIPIRVPVGGRDLGYTYNWMEQHKNDLNKIGYHWILESTKVSQKALYEQYDRLDKQLVENGCESRSAKNWACVGIFAKSLADEFLPNFNYYEYLFKISKNTTEEERDDDLISQFFLTIETMMALESNPFTGEHMRREGDKLYIWMDGVFKEVQKDSRWAVKESFSKGAIRAALEEEAYCIGTPAKIRKEMGTNRNNHRVYVIDLKNPGITESLLNISKNCES